MTVSDKVTGGVWWRVDRFGTKVSVGSSKLIKDYMQVSSYSLYCHIPLSNRPYQNVCRKSVRYAAQLLFKCSLQYSK